MMQPAHNREPYAHLTDAELDAVIADWTEPEPEGMVVTDLDAWESEQYEAWCVARERKEAA